MFVYEEREDLRNTSRAHEHRNPCEKWENTRCFSVLGYSHRLLNVCHWYHSSHFLWPWQACIYLALPNSPSSGYQIPDIAPLCNALVAAAQGGRGAPSLPAICNLRVDNSCLLDDFVDSMVHATQIRVETRTIFLTKVNTRIFSRLKTRVQ